MKINLRFSLLLAFILCVAASASSQTQGGVDILLAKARSLEARGLMNLAADNWRKVLLVHPNQTEALAGLARNAKENGQTAKENDYLDRLRKVNPQDPQIEEVKKLRVFTPDERSRLDEAGRLAMQHKPDAAMKIYREVLGDTQPPLGKWAQPFYETEAASTGGLELAIGQLRQLSKQFPHQEAYRLWLASLLSYDPKTRMEAFQLFESIDDPGFAGQAHAPWHKALVWEEKNPQALAPIEAYLQRYPDPELQAAATALHGQQQQLAADQARQQGFKALKGNRLDAAAMEFNAVLSHSPNDANALIGLGYVRLDQKRFAEAFGFFDRARKLAPQRQDARDGYDSANFWLAMQRGADAQREKQPQAAALAFQNALSLRPLDNGALLGLANAQMQERMYAQAESKFQQVLAQDPNNLDALSGLGFVRLNEGKFGEAQRLLAKARKLDPSRKDVNLGYRSAEFWDLMHQGAAALNQNQAKAAAADYRQAALVNPNDKDALRGLANACMRSADYAEAAKAYYQLVAAYPADESNWTGLIRAQMAEQTPQAAIATAQRIPAPAKQKLEDSSEFESEMALIYYKANQNAAGDQTIQRALQLAKASDSKEALSLRLQIASNLMNEGRTALAIEIYIEATHSHPSDPSGWEALVGAYTGASDYSDAIRAVRSMPKQAYDAAVKDAGFLDSVAMLYSWRGQCSEAQDLLQRSLSLNLATGRRPDQSTQLQLADVWMREHSYAQAQNLYQQIVASDANSAQAWRGNLVALHLERADRTVVAEIPRIPPDIRKRLETDPDFLILEASAHSSSGQNQDALTLLQEARSSYSAMNKVAPVDLDIQTAWTMLAVSPNEAGLGDLLLSAKSRAGLTAQQRAALEELWSVWSVRRAELAFKKKPQLALSILADAGQEYPNDRNIHIALASLYLKRHDKEKALTVFQTWDMAGAQGADFRMAAGAALAAHKNDLAEQYLRRGLVRFPKDSGLMHMTAQRDIARGDYNAGESELRSALLALREEGTPEAETKAIFSTTPLVNAGSSSISHNGAGENSKTFSSVPPCKAEPTGTSEARIRPISLMITVPQDQSGAVPSPNAEQPTGGARVQRQSEENQMEDEMEAVDNRNTPVITTGDTGTGRVGDAGIDRLVINDSVVRAAYTFSNRVRFGVEAHGVYAYSGTPDGYANLPFGTLPAYSLFGTQSKTGYSGLAQLSTKTFGVAGGISPQGFAVHNVIGGIRFRPGDGPLTLMAVRDSVKDSLLSYAGARDPSTDLRWGGVVANTGTISFNTAPRTNASYQRVGIYVSGSYSFLQGLNVPDNWSATANAGLYWQMVQGLTLGVNGSAEHYNRNLKYFSFGQGGYFSPQQYLLASVPISWYSRHPRFEYAIRFSGGLQYLQENSTPLYPVLPLSALVQQGSYASDSSVAANYDLNLHFGYRVAPHVYLGAFATANNARDYYSQSAGFSLKFMIDRIPTRTDLRVNSIPDWEGQQPFAVQ